MKYFFNTEVFTFEHNGSYVAYVPFRRLVFEINRSGKEIIENLSAEGVKPDPDNLEFMNMMMEFELIEKRTLPDQITNLPLPDDSIGRCNIGRPADNPLYGIDSLTLFLTTKCNLGCIYCYAHGGESDISLEWEDARAMIDIFLENAAKAGLKECSVGFHGGGEPTIAWDVMTAAVSYAKERASTHAIDVHFALSTNGMMSDEKRDWLAQSNFDVSISLDGFSVSQNSLRPALSGEDSFDEVLKTVTVFDNAKAVYSIRATVTALNIAEMPGFVEYLFDNTNCTTVQLEPLYLKGRGLGASADRPEVSDFVKMFHECRMIAESKKRNIFYSGAKYPDTQKKFCKAYGGSICLTPDLYLSSCYEVVSPSSPLSDFFLLGTFNRDKQEMEIDTEKLNRLSSEGIFSLSGNGCSDCFSKYHCAGDCPAKKSRTGSANDPYRCRINREIVKQFLIDALEKRGEVPFSFN